MKIHVTIWTALLFLLASCGPHMSGKSLVEQSLPSGSRLAVLPFENLSGTEHASEKATDYFIFALQAHQHLETIELGQLYEQMRRLRIRSAALLTRGQIDSLSAALDLGYLVTGSVLEYTESDNSYLGKIPQVSLNVKLIECSSGKTVWTGVANARGDQGETLFGIGAVRSLDELTRSIVEKAAAQVAALFRQSK